MAPKSLDPWLAQLLKDEIAAVIDWKRQHVPGVKADPDCRFSDDGSNFRSEVDTLPGTGEVQLIEVLTSEDIVTVDVADGNLKVKARLSAEAIATFEEELGEPITTETCGDILQLKKFTIISTPFGPADGFVQLQIDEIGYRNEVLRRTFGNPSPVEDNYTIRTLIESIKLLRVPKVSPESGGNNNNRPQPQVPPKSAAPKPLAASVHQPQQVVQTQVPVKPKPRGPTLGKDGYEVEGGLNLQGPVRPVVNGAKSGASHKSAGNPAALLSLFKQAKAPAASRTSVARERGVQEQQDLFTSQIAAPIVTISADKMGPVSQASSGVLTTSTAVRPTTLSSIAASNATARDPPSAHSPNEVRPATASRNIKSLFAYASRKVPEQQRNLLNSPSSWLPSLPGKQFPKPNIPIELLMKWNDDAAAAKAAASGSNSVLSRRSAIAPSQTPAYLEEAVEDSGSDSELSDSASQEFTPSPSQNWRARGAVVPATGTFYSATQSDVSTDDLSRPPSESPSRPTRPDLPPSSTLGSVIRATPIDGELGVATPRPLPVGRPPNKRKAEEMTAPTSKRQSTTPKPPAINPSPGTSLRHALPSRPMPPPITSPASAQRTSQHASNTSQFSRSARTSPAMSSQQISSQAANDDVTKSNTQASPARPYSSQHPASKRWPASVSVESTQQDRPSLPLADRYAPTQPKQSNTRATTSLELFKQGKLTHPPPSEPRSSLPNRYQSAQPLRGVNARAGNRASQPGELQRNGISALSASPYQAPAGSLQSTQTPRPAANPDSQRTSRQAVIVDVTDPSFERFSQSISPEWRQRTATAQTNGQSPSQSSWQPQDASTQLRVATDSVRSPGQSQTTAQRSRGMLSRRKAWIKLNYMASRNGNTSMQVVLQHYQQAFPDDNVVGIEDILVAARYAFDKMKVDMEMRFMGRFAGSKAYAVAKQELADILQRDSEQATPAPQQVTAPVAQKNASARHSGAKGSPLPPNHPQLMQQQARRQFMNEERRKQWLKGAYSPASNGTARLDAVLEVYKHACPEDIDVQLEDILSAARAVFPSSGSRQFEITASTWFQRTLPLSITENHLGEKDDPVQEHRMRTQPDIQKWVRTRYLWDPEGSCREVDMLTTYQSLHPDVDVVDLYSFRWVVEAAYKMSKKETGVDRWRFTEIPDATRGITREPTGTSTNITASSVVQSSKKACLSDAPKKPLTPSECKNWLRERFFQDPDGSYSIEDVAAAYEDEITGDNRSNFEQAISMLLNVKKRDIGGATFSRVREPAGTRSGPQIPKAPPSQRDAEAALKSHQEWFYTHYVRDESGLLSIRDLIQSYRHQRHIESVGVKDGALVKSLHKAFGLVKKTTRFSKIAGALPPSRNSKAIDAAITTTPVVTSDVAALEDPTLDSAHLISEFCAAYLALGSGKGNAFATISTGKKTGPSLVDALGWDL